MSQLELEAQPSDVSYQRMRYERSIEGTLYAAYLRKGFTNDKAVKAARERADYIVANWDRINTNPKLLEV